MPAIDWCAFAASPSVWQTNALPHVDERRNNTASSKQFGEDCNFRNISHLGLASARLLRCLVCIIMAARTEELSYKLVIDICL